MPSGCFFTTKIERYIKKQSILFNISIWYYNFIKKLYEIAKERKQKWEVSFMKKKLVLAMAATMAITSCAVPVLADDAAAEGGKIGISMPTQSLERWNR